MIEKSNVFLTDKEELKITGVNKINSLDKTHFNLDTTLGNLRIYGNNLEMVELDSTNKTLQIKGEIETITYMTILKNKENFIKKLLK